MERRKEQSSVNPQGLLKVIRLQKKFSEFSIQVGSFARLLGFDNHPSLSQTTDLVGHWLDSSDPKYIHNRLYQPAEHGLYEE